MMQVLERMSTRMLHRKLFSTDEWDYNEVSTRNCVHCLSDKDGYIVTCSRGNKLLNGNRQYTFNYIVKFNQLIPACQNCEYFSNKWDEV